ncbi:MAG: hypothetical protein NVS2B7_25000 [Herpetosiphon sp.]
MKGADPDARGQRVGAVAQSFDQLAGGACGEGHDKQLLGRGRSNAKQGGHTLNDGVRFAAAGSSHDKKMTVLPWKADDLALDCGEYMHTCHPAYLL